MSNSISKKTESCILNLEVFEKQLLDLFKDYWLPYENILVWINERARFFHNIWYTLDFLEPNKKWKAIYISKFLSAVWSGLFDAALNYLWNETINDLRAKIKWYNINYFYDTLNIWENRRKDLKSEEDLEKLTDDELKILNLFKIFDIEN